MHEPPLPIYILGAGTVGQTLAVLLQAAGRQLILIRGSLSDGAAYRKNLRIITGANTTQEEISFSTFGQLKRIDGLVLVTAKAFGNQALARQLRPRSGSSPIVLLQNGLDVEQPFIEQGFPEIFRCVLFMSSQYHPDGGVLYRSVAPSAIGPVTQQNTTVEAIVNQINIPDFPFRADPDIRQTVWEKAIINCAFNSICPLLDTDNGIFQRDEKALEIARQVIGECVAVAAELDIPLDPAKIEERLLFISRSSDGQLISTLQDIRGGRQTEIDSLNLAVANRATALGKPGLATLTGLLGRLLKLRSGF